MAKTYAPVPPADDLAAIIRAALANAADLLDEAELLAGNERYPRAYALAILAWEEVSKAHHCLWAACSAGMTPARFWTGFLSHEGKLSAALYHAEYLRPEPITTVAEHFKRMTGGSRSAQNQKERALYVDYRRGKVLVPGQIGQRAARTQIRAARIALAEAVKFDPAERIAAWALVSGAVDALLDSQPDTFRTAFQVAQRDGDWEPLGALVSEVLISGAGGDQSSQVQRLHEWAAIMAAKARA